MPKKESLYNTIVARKKIELRNSRKKSLKRSSINNLKNSPRRNLFDKIVNFRRHRSTKPTSGMALDFERIYDGCGNAQNAFGKDLEVQNLKELLLLHLDVIQQQAEQLVAKDREIKTLKDDNECLRARLERIDRRVSLSLHKRGGDALPQSATPTSQEPLYIAVNNLNPDWKPESPTVSLLTTEEKLPKKPIVIWSNKPSNSPKVSPRERRMKRDGGATTPYVTWDEMAPLRNSALPSTASPPLVSPGIKRKMDSVLVEPTPKRHASGKLELIHPIQQTPQVLSGEKLTDHSLRSREKHPPGGNKTDVREGEPLESQLTECTPPNVDVPAESVRTSFSISERKKLWRQLKPKGELELAEGLAASEDKFICTSSLYYLPFMTMSSEPTAGELLQAQIEIPSWRQRSVTSLYVMEGTENLEDEIFLKRHSKLEQDEKRRKRWDLQRMREQRQYDRLLERYENRNGQGDGDTGAHLSLWPNADGILFVNVDEEVPVCAFGQALSVISDGEFSLPWMKSLDILNVKRRKRIQ